MQSDYLTIQRAGPTGRAIAQLFVIIAASVAAGCGGDGSAYGGPTDPGSGGSGEPGPAATVRATPAIQFTPATVELSVGGTVTFDFGAVEHTVYFDNAPPGAPANITAPSANETIARTFTTAGQYRYNCHIHPGMTGIINVH